MGRHTEVVARASRSREAANALILRELERHGVKGLVPSHGSLLCLLYAETNVSMCVLAERLRETINAWLASEGAPAARSLKALCGRPARLR